MSRTPAQAAAWFRSGVPRTINRGDWEGGCVAAVFNGGAYGHSYDYAVGAAVAAGAVYAGGARAPLSGRLNINASQAGDGSVHYWGGIWNTQYKRWDGHIGIQYGGLIYMASLYARQQFGHHLGASTWAQYNADRGLPYLGHSPYFGNQVLAGVSPASIGQTPIDNGGAPAAAPEDLMSFKLGYVTDNNGALYTLFDLTHGRYAQTRDQAVANLWDLLYMPPGVPAQDFGSPASNGSLAVLLSGGGFVSEPWPWKPGADSGAVDAGALAAQLAPAVKDALAGVATAGQVDGVVAKVLAGIKTKGTIELTS